MESTAKDTIHDVEQFKARGLNVVGVLNFNDETPPQDIVIFLRPYLVHLSRNFQADAMTPQTLWVYIHYGFETTTIPAYYNYPMFRLPWRIFFDSEFTRRLFDTKCRIGIPRAYASGLPKMDILSDTGQNFSFPWKMIRPDAKKIIWAPHWSFEEDEIFGKISTFHYNFRFMYEFTKAHPEMI